MQSPSPQAHTAQAKAPRATSAAATTRALFTGQSTTGPGLAMPQPHADDDFVDDVLALVARLVPGMTPEHAAQAAQAVRERWGGDRPFIARRAGEGRSGRNEQIRRDYLRGERLALLERRYGLSQRHLIRIVKG